MKKLLLTFALASAVPAVAYGPRYAYFQSRPGFRIALAVGDPCWDSMFMGPDGLWYIDQCPYFVQYPSYYYSYVPGWWYGFGFGGGRRWSGNRRWDGRGGRGGARPVGRTWSGARGGAVRTGAVRTGGAAHVSGGHGGGHR